MKITLRMSQEAYPVAKKVYSGQLTRTDGKSEINRISGISEGSAQAYITIFLAMMSGKEYKRVFNNDTNRLLFESIRRDFGERYYANALNAAQKHINYYANLRKGNLSGLQKIVNELKH